MIRGSRNPRGRRRGKTRSIVVPRQGGVSAVAADMAACRLDSPACYCLFF